MTASFLLSNSVIYNTFS